MALHEPYEKQAQQQWYARLARERLDLSASVEATLADTSSQEDQWSDRGEYTGSAHTSRKMTLIPPRFSLQSRMLPAVQTSTQDMQSVTHTHSTTPTEVEGERRAVSAAKSPNILARLARRITSSLAAFGTSGQPLAPPGVPSPLLQESQGSSGRRDTPGVVPGEAVPVFERTDSSSMPFIDALPSARPPMESVPPVRSKRRLAGHTTKIRLQTASTPTVTPHAMQVVPVPPDPPTMALTHERLEVREPVEVRVRLARPEIEKKAATANILRVDGLQREDETTSREQRSEDALFGAVDTTSRGMLSGSGVFESGQSDLVVHNTHITESSVVVVMLTSNPGPVVVQYVSLHPHVGFTIHLTAPVTMKTSFNYVVLLGELF